MMRHSVTALAVFFSALIIAPHGVGAQHKADMWRNRRVYQILTDRFARSWQDSEKKATELVHKRRLSEGHLNVGEALPDPTAAEIAEVQAHKCDDLTNYCGGSFKGITENLDYIQGLGFDAIWISPIIKNWDGGYHGYWAKDLFSVNEKFGTHDELVQLSDELKKRGMYFMVDVVANHMSPAPQVPDVH